MDMGVRALVFVWICCLFGKIQPFLNSLPKVFRSVVELHELNPNSPTNNQQTPAFTLSTNSYGSLAQGPAPIPPQSAATKPPINPEEKLNLEISIESQAFLKNIREYGKNRTARRAVGILQKMPAYKVTPTELHYTQALWACENSQQYSLGMSVFDEMKLKGIPRSIYTYEALISLAEKTNHLKETLDYFDQMKQDTLIILRPPSPSTSSSKEEGTQKSLVGTTSIYNSCLIACEKLKDLAKANQLFTEMEEFQVEKDIVTYTAIIAVCEKVGNADRALEIFEHLEEEIQAQRLEEIKHLPIDPLEAHPTTTLLSPQLQSPQRKFLGITTDTANLLLWACIKGREPRQAIKLFHTFNDKNQYPYITPDVTTYNAIIWAHEMIGEAIKAEGYLTVMKMNHIKPQTMTYDGVISAYAKQNQYEPILNLLKCMTNECIPKSPISYQLAIDCLDRQSNENQEISSKAKKLHKPGTTSSTASASSSSGTALSTGASDDSSNNDQFGVSSSSSPPSKYSNNHYYFNYINDVYFSALRDGFFNPWIKGTRQLDLRGFLLSICKVAVKSILLSMLEKKLSVFTLEMTVAEERIVSEKKEGVEEVGGEGKEVKEIVSSFDIELFYDYLSTLHLYSWGENSISPKKELEIQTKQEGSLLKYVITRESLVEWLDHQQ